MNKSTCLIGLLLFFIIACSEGPKKKTATTAVTDTKTTEEVPLHPKNALSVHIITTGMFHQDEVWDDMEKMQWIGLFKGSNGYYLKQTKVRSIRVNDPVLDEEHQKTGWELSTFIKDTNVLLISASAGLSEGKIDQVALSKVYIFPGDTVSFRYRGVNYQLFASGKKERESETSDWYLVSDYKLYLTARIDGMLRKTLLSDHYTFDDSMVFLIFAGDLDRDGIADIILDDSYHYNMTEPTVYLSRKAGKGQVVKRIASHKSVGC